MYQEYPKVMTHPAQSQAVVHGEPARLQPVTVNSKDQEEEYEAKGYRAFSDQGAFDRIKASVEPTAYTYQEYPKWVDGKIVKSRDEEDAMAVVDPEPTDTNRIPAPAQKIDKRTKEYRESHAAA